MTEKDKAAPKKKAPPKKKKVRRKADNNQETPTKKRKGTTGKNGGHRPGAGRKKGAATKRTREIADKLAESQEITPLEYMLELLRTTPDKLREQHENGEIDDVQYADLLKSLRDRRDWAAERAAPYIHPRLSSIDANVKTETHEDWLERMAREEAEANG